MDFDWPAKPTLDVLPEDPGYATQYEQAESKADRKDNRAVVAVVIVSAWITGLGIWKFAELVGGLL